MTHFDSFYDIIQGMGVPCYRMFLSNPTDLVFQLDGISGYLSDITVSTLSPVDGSVQESDILSYFSLISLGGNRIGFILNNYTPYMCFCKRFVLYVSSIEYGYEVYLGMFEIGSCCPSEYVVDVDGEILGVTDMAIDGWVLDCHGNRLSFETWNDCNDIYTGDYYSEDWHDKINLKGEIIIQPLSLEKTLSRNCTQLYTSTEDVYDVTIHEYLPGWRLRDLEYQLLHQYILINGVRYYYDGGVIAKRNTDICEINYEVAFSVKKCPQRQYFACGDVCEAVSVYYYKITVNDLFYNESRQYLGNKDSWEKWMNGQGGKSFVYDTESSNYILTTKGTAPYFYIGGTNVRNRVYPSLSPIAPVISFCGSYVVQSIIVEVAGCGTYHVESVTVVDSSTVMQCVPVEVFFTIGEDGGGVILKYELPEFVNTEFKVISKNDIVLSSGTGYTWDNGSGTITFIGVAAGDAIHMFAISSFTL